MKFQRLSVFAALIASVQLLTAQWTSAPSGQYPQSQYPQNQNPENQPQPQQSQTTTDSPDPADLQHGVARISIAQGDVNIQRGDNGQLSGAVVNAPLLTRDHLQTSGGSRAEVQLDASTMLRLGPNTDLGFADIEYHRAQVQLGLGTIIFRVLPNAQAQVEIDTPSIGIRALSPGEYRISVFDNGTSQVTVRNGQLELSGPRASEQLNPGSSVLVRGDAADPEMQTSSEIARDQFDQWSEDRDREFNSPQSYRYVNADVQGAADLDQYGNWVPSGYGQAWHPQGVAADWSPYSNGQWSYVDYYGWSWIDYSPWGWAPYHYGRWFWNTGVGWCWWPGARGYHAYWSPALVGFFGIGRGIGIGFGALGWVALAPFEAFHSWWGRGFGGFGFGGGFRAGAGIGFYRNASIRGGAMTAAYNGFGGPHQRFAAATRSEIQGASAFNGRLPMTANRVSLNYSNRTPVQSNRFANTQSRTFFHQNSTARSFATPTARTFSAPNSATTNGAGGWQHFGSPNTGINSNRANYANSETSGWHSFGRPQTGGNSFQSQHNTYQSAPRSFGQPSYQQPRYNNNAYSSGAATQRYNAPHAQRAQPQQHYTAPASHGGGGGHSEVHSSGGGGGHSGGGGGHHR